MEMQLKRNTDCPVATSQRELIADGSINCANRRIFTSNFCKRDISSTIL